MTRVADLPTRWAHSCAIILAVLRWLPVVDTPGVYNSLASLYVMIPQCSVAPDA